MLPNTQLFTQILIASLILLVIVCWRKLSLTRLGKPVKPFGNIPKRLVDALRFGIGQERVVKIPFGTNHLLLVIAFVILLINHPMLASVETALEGTRPSGSLIPYPKSLLLPAIMLLDLTALLAFATATAAVLRRLIAPPYKGANSFVALAIPLLLSILCLAYFGVNAAKINHFMSTDSQLLARAWLPVSSLFASLVPSLSLEALYYTSWWTHGAAVILLICCLPFTKLLHIVTVIPNIFLRRQEQPVIPEREQFETGNRFGIDQVDGYTWKELLDGFSCTECGRCQNVCPATLTGKSLNPREIIRNLKLNLQHNAPALKRGDKPVLPLIGDNEGSISEEAIWACTTCGACLESCPVFIEQMPKLIPLRRHLVEMESKFPEELLNLFENMEGRSNPWGIAPSERGKWATLLGERPFVPGSTEYLFYVGCAGSFDSRAKQVTLALAQLLDKAGVSWGILGKEELCCGDSLRRLGNEYIFERMAQQNVTLFKEKGVHKVVVLCPHCLSTLQNDYRQYGIELEVVHHSQLLNSLVKEGRLQLPRTTAEYGSLTYHDSCYLARHNGIIDEPRETLAHATGKAPLEMERSKKNGFCCGAGGGRMWMEEFSGERINLERVKEAVAMQPDTVCTACPYCMTMIADGLKDLSKDEQIKVRDIAEIMADAALR